MDIKDQMDAMSNILKFDRLPVSFRLLFLVTVVCLSVGYVFNLTQIWESHSGEGGILGISAESIRMNYYGKRDSSVLESKLNTTMSGFVTSAEKENIIKWIRTGADKAMYDSEIKPVIERNCMVCHGSESFRSLYSYEEMKAVTNINQGMGFKTLVRVSHIHLNGMTFLFFISGFITCFARIGSKKLKWVKWIVIIAPLIAMFSDIMSWNLAREYENGVYFVIMSGMVMTIAFFTQMSISAYQIIKSFNVLFPLSCFFVLFLFLPSFVFADEPNETFLFKKLAVPDTDDLTEKACGKEIGKTVRDELEQMLRFDVIQLPTQSSGKTSEKPQADGFIVCRASHSHEMVNISLEILDRRREMFALELLAVNEQASPAELENSVRELVVKLIRRIPYKAVITRVENGVVTFDEGRVHGVEVGSKIPLFEITGVIRHPYTNEIISFSREDLGTIEVTRVDALSATGNIISSKKGVKINAGHKVAFTPSERVIRESLLEKNDLLARRQSVLELRKTREQQLTKKTTGRSRGSLAAGAGVLLNDYKISSNEFNFSRDTSSPVPVVAVAGEYWVLEALGADVSYAASRIYFQQTGSIPKTDASLSWLAAHLKYRWFFSNSPLSPEIVGSVGYQIYDYEVDQSDLNYFNNIKYSGIDLAVAASYPVTSKIKGVLNVGYQPLLDVKETPVTSGTNPDVYGYFIGLTGYFKVSDRAALTPGYYYQAYHADFSGTGTRGVGTTDAEIRDIYQGVNLSLVYEL